jgi:hypothetical protein
MISGPKDKADSFVNRLGHVAIRVKDRVYDMGRYAETLAESFRDAAPDSVGGIAGGVGRSFGATILLVRAVTPYLREVTRHSHVRIYYMKADAKDIREMSAHLDGVVNAAQDISHVVRASREEKYLYLQSILRTDTSARAYELPSMYKLVGNSCLDLVAETLDSAYWFWDFDNLLTLTPEGLSARLESGAHRYTAKTETQPYRGQYRDPGWWFQVTQGGQVVLNKREDGYRP